MPIVDAQPGLKADLGKPWIARRQDGHRGITKKESSAVTNNGIDDNTTHPLRSRQKNSLGNGDFDNTLDHALGAVSLQQIKNATGPMLADGP